ncbi:uncharacterized protein TNCV_1173201 [Trichonephila clavipes]|uniref:Uncharacterized protein n=1 Tax=Trichonephila clavipes TaxID=2585209 RepID=A0A8X6RWW8_TRICX|nr:uncharacterized protein TNCV_1173201 [Trichonephila clavipes]
MALKSNRSVFSDFDSDYLDASVFNDTHEFLNLAFIGSPNESLCLHNDSPLSNLSLLLYSNGELKQESKNDSKIRALSENEDTKKPSYKNLSDLNYPDEVFQNKTPTKDDLKPYETIQHSSLTTEKCNDTNEFYFLPKWKYTQQGLPKTRTNSYQNLEPESFAEISSISDYSDSKFATRPLGIDKRRFGKDSGTTFLPKLTPEMCAKNSWDQKPEEPKMHTEFDYSNLVRRYLTLETECDSQEFANKFGKRQPQWDYVYHELSTIQEMNSMSTNEICESLVNSSACDDVEDSDCKATPEIFKPSVSEDCFIKRELSSSFPLNDLKIIQNHYIEQLIQERGILEESDLTLVSNEFTNPLTKYLEKSTEHSGMYSICKRRSSYNMDSPSLISFLQHEMSCMEH